MKPHPFATICRVLFLSFLFAALFCLPARAAGLVLPCGTGQGETHVPANDATVYAATPPEFVSVIDAVTNSVCTITVGFNPGNLAVSPDSKYLFVENDDEGTVTVINLLDGSLNQKIILSGLPMT